MALLQYYKYIQIRKKVRKSVFEVFVAAVERLTALHYSVDFIFLSFGIMGFIVEL